MKGYDGFTYGDAIADHYDDWFPKLDSAMIDRLVELAGAGNALELGIGTGRVALPLHHRGIEVQGIDASPRMVERLRAKPGGADLSVTIADFASFESDQRFALIYVVFNTLFVLPTQRQQLGAFGSVARALAPGGSFVVEAFVPDPTRFDRGQAMRVVDVAVDGVRLECSVHDRATQQVSSQIVELGRHGVRLHPIHLRYAWPSELDLMAELAGLALVHRWGDWQGQPFTAESPGHVSVYQRAESP